MTLTRQIGNNDLEGMGITLIQLILPLAIAAGGDSVDADIHSVSLPTNASTDGTIQFVVETSLPADCYSLKPAAIRMVSERNVILFHIEANKIADTCLAGDTRLAEVVTVGPLPKGNYEVRALKDLKVWGKLRVSDQISYAKNP